MTIVLYGASIFFFVLWVAAGVRGIPEDKELQCIIASGLFAIAGGVA